MHLHTRCSRAAGEYEDENVSDGQDEFVDDQGVDGAGPSIFANAQPKVSGFLIRGCGVYRTCSLTQPRSAYSSRCDNLRTEEPL